MAEKELPEIPDNKDPVREALEELRRERAEHFDKQWPEPTDEEE